jgi:predicted amidohydrolase YtcJ
MRPALLLPAMALSVITAATAQNSATLLLINGNIWTGNSRQPHAQAIAIAGNRIAAVGATDEILRWKQPGTQVADLQGHLVLPGFDDAHVHFYFGGANLTGPQLRYAKSGREMREMLAAFATHVPRGRWITGGNWDHENWNPPQLPDRKLIDGVTKDWPVFLKRIDGHISLANSVALELAGIGPNTPNPPGGIIVRDAAGNPTGILKDAAQSLVERMIPPPSEEQIVSALEAAQAYANSQGVTSVQDMSCAPDVFRAYQTMLRSGRLHVRVACAQPLVSWRRLADVGVMADFGTAWLHIGGVKGFADGSLGAGTAWFFKPYADAPSNSGIPSDELSNPARMWNNIEAADKAGLQIHIHAIGDRANHTILDFYERLEQEHGPRDRRLRIEHAQHLLPEDIPRFAKLHVIASMQPYHCIDDGRWAEQRIGHERAKTSYAFRSLLDSGAMLAFGSDWDVAPMDVMKGIYAAVTRRTLDGKHPEGWIPEQKISVEEAVRAYTLGSAYASFDESIKGTIEPGKLADLAVISDDIFTIDPVKIFDAKVLATIFNGTIVSGEIPPLKDRSGLVLR